MAVVVPWRDLEIEVGGRHAPRYWLLEVQLWVAVDGEAVIEVVSVSPEGEVLGGGFLDRAGNEHQLRLELGKIDGWRGRLPFILLVDAEEVARGRTRLGVSTRQNVLIVIVTLLALVGFVVGLVLVA